MMTAFLFALLIGHMPTENWMNLDGEKRKAAVGIMAKRYFAVNQDCAEAEITIEVDGETTYFYGKCKKPLC